MLPLRSHDEHRFVYKICPAKVWESIKNQADWEGSAHDLRDGFIHFSAEHQVPGTLKKHFASQADLVLLTVDVQVLPQPIRWEASRGAEEFPHLYSKLPIAAVTHVEPIRVDSGDFRPQ